MSTNYLFIFLPLLIRHSALIKSRLTICTMVQIIQRPNKCVLYSEIYIPDYNVLYKINMFSTFPKIKNGGAQFTSRSLSFHFQPSSSSSSSCRTTGIPEEKHSSGSRQFTVLTHALKDLVTLQRTILSRFVLRMHWP